MMTTIPFGVAPLGGSVTYVGRLWIVSTLPAGVPSCRVPDTQSLQGMEAAIMGDVSGDEGIVSLGK